MGYKITDIADITEPREISLADDKNFLIIKSYPRNKRFLEKQIKVNIKKGYPYNSGQTKIVVYRGTPQYPRGDIMTIEGTEGTPNENQFKIENTQYQTTVNIQQKLLSNEYIKAHFDIFIPFGLEEGEVVNGNVLYIKSKGAGYAFTVTFSTPNDPDGVAYTHTDVTTTSDDYDTIKGSNWSAYIEIEVYTNCDVKLGDHDYPTTPAVIGTLATVLAKTYIGRPLWFELNSLFNGLTKYNAPRGPFNSGEWFDTGTILNVRIVAKRNTIPFYVSNALKVVNGKTPQNREIDLNEYVFDGTHEFKLLTNKPMTPYVKGQKEYINFIFRDTLLTFEDGENYVIGVMYQALNSAGEFMGSIESNITNRKSLNEINTCRLLLDDLINIYPNLSFIKVALYKGQHKEKVSNFITYEVRPESVHICNTFTFLNSLGGWDSFNFDAPTQKEIAPKADTYKSTPTPENNDKTHGVEIVKNVNLNQLMTIDGAMVTNEIAEWLKELATSKCIIDNDGNNILIDSFTLKESKATDNQHQPILKYRYNNEQ